VAVVGARACTAYGEHVAAELAAVVAERGWTVVSGAAYGIDAAAHRGALAVGGTTVAVLACGVDVAYPRGHAGLLARVVDDGGAVVSELPPGERVTRTRFLERNRVIAALTRGTVVVEAAARSGALSTAGRARDLGRHVMAVPGPVTSAASVGCHEALRTKDASLVAGGAHVLDLVGDLGVDDVGAARGEDRAHDGLQPDALRVLEALPTHRPLGVEKIVVRAGLAVPTVLAALSELSERGLARGGASGWRLERAPAPPDHLGLEV
jgi:DNA processing protein